MLDYLRHPLVLPKSQVLTNLQVDVSCVGLAVAARFVGMSLRDANVSHQDNLRIHLGPTMANLQKSHGWQKRQGICVVPLCSCPATKNKRRVLTFGEPTQEDLAKLRYITSHSDITSWYVIYIYITSHITILSLWFISTSTRSLNLCPSLSRFHHRFPSQVL